MGESQARGMLTQRVQDKALELMGREISTVELRLMPYVQYVAMNDQYIDMRRVSDDDHDTLAKWKEEGRVICYQDNLELTKEFWGTLHEILYLSYVDLYA